MNDNFDDMNEFIDDNDSSKSTTEETTLDDNLSSSDVRHDSAPCSPSSSIGESSIGEEPTKSGVTKDQLLNELKDIQQDFTFGKIDAFLLKYQVRYELR